MSMVVCPELLCQRLSDTFHHGDFPVPIRSFTNNQFPNCAEVVTDLAWGRVIATRLDLAKKWRLSF
jgi:hypothetical protein